MSAPGRIYWVLHRLSVMSPGELLYRASRLVSGLLRPGQRWLEKRVAGHGGQPAWPDFQFFTSSRPALFRPPTSGTVPDPDRMLSGGIPIYGHWTQWTPDEDFWHTDPTSRAKWPMRPSRAINYRPGNPTGDVRVVWELNRLQHLFSLARIATDQPGSRSQAVTLLAKQFSSWRSENPPGMGVNGISALELALRLIALLHAFDLVREWVDDNLRQELLEVALDHATRIEDGLSLFSSAGNHTIGEALGLLYAGTLLPEATRAARWHALGRQLLAQEGRRQVLADGGGCEQSTWYHLFVVEALGLSRMLLEHQKAAPIPEVTDVLARARRFLSSLGGSASEIPRLGDSDDGFALCPDLAISWIPGLAAGHHDFPQAGLAAISGPANDRLFFLHNELGLPPNFAHAHGHCLSVLLECKGQRVLIDPGTYMYGGKPGFREYFRSTRAHNTVSIDGRDQARQIGPFMWGKPFRAQRLFSGSVGDGALILASHDGYRQLDCTHFRGVYYHPTRFLAVWDRIVGPPNRDARAHWHLGVKAIQIEHSNTVELYLRDDSRITMESTAASTSITTGARDPLLGWKSDSYGELAEAPTIASTLADGTLLTIFWLPGATRDRSAIDSAVSDFERRVATDCRS